MENPYPVAPRADTPPRGVLLADRRRACIRLWAVNPTISPTYLAKELEVTRQTIHNWITWAKQLNGEQLLDYLAETNAQAREVLSGLMRKAAKAAISANSELTDDQAVRHAQSWYQMIVGGHAPPRPASEDAVPATAPADDKWSWDEELIEIEPVQ